ncbi:hypothetical protein JMJ77_0006130 [Colletotrichum scovillei]|uniref:Uncharacterized protein n=1 Tax=Colletotrichum scovillei TaxID=1209932 RepID=A0A9P7RIN4_9PEZI|nr:hypothetical protein JMJ77_0006130 [Colletotrichum scovillei]KAG7077363.1 hypothetical protein JMJ76_0014611 [Colletotrichum scovillei]
MEGDSESAAEALSQPPAKRIKLSSSAPENVKPVFGRLDVALNTDDSGDVTVNVSNTRRLGKPVIDHLSDETFAFHGSRQQVHAMIDRILDYSENSIITGIVSLQPDTSESAPQSKTPITTEVLKSTATVATVSESRASPNPDTSMSERLAKSTATEVEASAHEGPSTLAVTPQSQQTSKVVATPKPVTPQNSSLVLTRSDLKTAFRAWMAGGQRVTKLLTLLKKLPESDSPNPSVECMVLQKLAGKKPDMMVGDLLDVLRSWMTSDFKRWVQLKHIKIGENWMHFIILRRLWFYSDYWDTSDKVKKADFPWAEMEPKWSEGQPYLAYATFREHNRVPMNLVFN